MEGSGSIIQMSTGHEHDLVSSCSLLAQSIVKILLSNHVWGPGICITEES